MADGTVAARKTDNATSQIEKTHASRPEAVLVNKSEHTLCRGFVEEKHSVAHRFHGRKQRKILAIFQSRAKSRVETM